MCSAASYHTNVTCWVIFSHRSSSGCSKGVSSLMVSSLGSSRMPPEDTDEMVEVFLEEDPAEMPESAESFLVKCLPKMNHFSIIMSLHWIGALGTCQHSGAWKWDQASADNMTHMTHGRERHVPDTRTQVRNLSWARAPALTLVSHCTEWKKSETQGRRSHCCQHNAVWISRLV